MRVGANVQPGQLVEVLAGLEHAPIVREVTRAAYRAGAVLRRRRATSTARPARADRVGAGDDILSWTPPWLLSRERTFGEQRAAIVALTGDAEPQLLGDLPGERVGKARMLELAKESSRQVTERLCNWTVVGVPNEGWATQMFGEPDVDRCGTSSSIASGSTSRIRSRPGTTHIERLGRRAKALDDLESTRSISRPGNRPDGRVAAGVALAGSRVRDGGRRHVRREHADRGGLHDARRPPDRGRRHLDDAALRPRHDRHGAPRAVQRRPHRRGRGRPGRRRDPRPAGERRACGALGEVALVDGTSRIGATGLTFFDTLYDEKRPATSPTATPTPRRSRAAGSKA